MCDAWVVLLCSHFGLYQLSDRTCALYLTRLVVIKAQTSLPPLSICHDFVHGSRVPIVYTAHAHQYVVDFRVKYEDCAVANEIDYEIDDV